MNDIDIIKALECCGTARLRELHTGENPCSNCPMQDCEDCEVELPDCALDLIKRQQAEIEQLTDKHWSECRQIMHYSDELREAIEKQTPSSKRAPFDDEAITCGNCDSDITDSDFTHCPYCGQKLDWSCLSNTETTFECDGKTYIIQFDDGEE